MSGPEARRRGAPTLRLLLLLAAVAVGAVGSAEPEAASPEPTGAGAEAAEPGAEPAGSEAGGEPPDRVQQRVEAAPLWDWIDEDLQRQLEREVALLGFQGPVRRKELGVAVVDLSDPERVSVAALNGDHMYYAASLPKIAVMLAVFELAEGGAFEIDPRTQGQLQRMIRDSSNPDSTALMHKVSKQAIAQVLESPRYGLYDRRGGRGGLWVGKDYAKRGLWRRDPIANFSHGATPIQTARFFTLLQRGELVSPEASREMKELLFGSTIGHKFVKGLRRANPDARVYRKSGTWRQHHADAALVEDGEMVYVAVGLARHHRGGEWLSRLIIGIDELFADRAIERARP